MSSKSATLRLQSSITSYSSMEHKTFSFLNLSHRFDNAIEWNFSEYGKLWTYNLTYFDFLQQEDISKEEGVELINDFIDQSDTLKDGLEPFPFSLRGINWVKFLVMHEIKDQKIDDSLYAQYHILMDNVEYHLLGNHLLENGFSLLFGAYYFQDKIVYSKAKQILYRELKEEILDDGGHFELSPMYHQLMLFRLLDCINLVKNNNYKEQELLPLLKDKAQVMLGWLNTMTFERGTIPLFNDSSNNIAPTTAQLNKYAQELELNCSNCGTKLFDCGYRKFTYSGYELTVDVGNIGPDYIPGHAHADTFNFELYVDNNPFIVDTGISTYDANEIRYLERSTQSHNTVVVDGLNQSEVWGAFRVANRAKIVELKESENTVVATHDGYKGIGLLHTRKFQSSDEQISIIDIIDSKKNHECLAYWHFHPDIDVKINGSSIITNKAKIVFQGHVNIELHDYRYAPEFNKTILSKCAVVSFKKRLTTDIIIKNIQRESYENN